MRTTTILLDFDGLLCDTERTAMQAWQDCYDRLGVPFTTRVRDRMIGDSGGARHALADLHEQLGRPLADDEWRWQRARRAELADLAPVRPGVEWLLDTARDDGRTLGVVSSSPASWVGRHLTRLGLRQRIDLVVTGDDTPRHKPAPDLYLLALHRAGVTAEEAIAVEDSPIGVQAAKAAGLRCVAVPGELGAGRDFSTADVVLPGLRWFDIERYDWIGV